MTNLYKMVAGQNFSKAYACHKWLQKINICKYFIAPPSDTALVACYIRQTNVFLW